ncbi:hypothetical protein Tco_1420092 [Tanacetum coccineum]
MSSSNHPTSNIKDAFSTNLPEYIPVVPDYFPASPSKTYSSTSNDSTEVIPPASSTFSLFHDDPYMEIEEILNHLDELPLDRIEQIEDDVEGVESQISNMLSKKSELDNKQIRKIFRMLSTNSPSTKKDHQITRIEPS